jgi:hypothetical protein
MRALSMTQPWATLLAHGYKTIETRSWRTDYRGPLAIHAAKGWPREAMELCLSEPFRSCLREAGVKKVGDLPRGAILGTCIIAWCARTENLVADSLHPAEQPFDAQEHAFGDYSHGRWGWKVANVRLLPEPIAARGALGLWAVPDAIVAQIQDEILRAPEELLVGIVPARSGRGDMSKSALPSEGHEHVCQHRHPHEGPCECACGAARPADPR